MNIREEIREFLLKGEELDVPIDDDESLLESGIIDSLKMVELLTFIEKQFAIDVEDDELMPENFDSINAITNFIGRKTGKEG